MSEQTFNDAMLDLRQAIAKQIGSHQAYVRAKINAVVSAHEREVSWLKGELICNGGDCERNHLGAEPCAGCKFVEESEVNNEAH